MKYALQLYGQLRSFQKSLPSLFYFIDYYTKEYDVFLFIDKGDGATYATNKSSNWSESNMSLLLELLQASRVKGIRYVDDMTEVEKQEEEKLTKEYYTLWGKFNQCHKGVEHNYFVTKLKYRTYLLNCMRTAYEKEHSITYEYVVRSRFDWGTTYKHIYEMNNQTTPIVFADTLTIGDPEFVNKEAELGLKYPYTPKCLFDNNCNLIQRKFDRFKDYIGAPYIIQPMWLFMPEYNIRCFLLDNNLRFIDAHWETPSNYEFKIIR